MIVLRSLTESSFSAEYKQQIKSGENVNVKVLKQLSDNTWQVSLRGKLIVVNSTLTLRTGSTIQAKASWHGQSLFLHVHKNFDSFSALFKELGLSNNATSRQIVEAIQRSKLPFKPELIELIVKQIGSKRQDEEMWIRLAVLLSDKKLFLPEPLLEGFFALISPPREREKGSERRKRDDTNQEEREDQEENSLRQKIEDALKKNLIRRTPGSSSVSAPLLLFNHLQAEHDNWLLLPFSLAIEESNYSGSIRLKTDELMKTIEKAVIAVATPLSNWTFVIDNMDSAKKTMQIFCDNALLVEDAAEKHPRFCEKLRKLGVESVDTIREEGSWDGFSSGEETVYKKIDTVI
jgi:hypothetical protein